MDPQLLDQLLGHPAWQALQSQLGSMGAQPAAPSPDQGGQPAPADTTSQDGEPASTPTALPDTNSNVPATGPAVQKAQEGVKVAQEKRGVNFDTQKKLQGQMPAVQQQMNAAEAGARAGEQPELQAQQATSQQAMGAAQELSTAQQGQATAQAQGDVAMSRLNSHLASMEQLAAAHAQAQTAQYRANLEGDIARVRAMRVNSGQLLQNMTGGEQFGTAIALFAQGFLGARGIQTGAREALSYWVDRNVADQEAAIRNGDKMVDNDRMLWDMARAQSHDDMEARDRVAAYITAQAQAEIKSTVDSYGSAIARANGDAAVASLQQDLNNRMATIVDRYDQKAHQASQAVWQQHAFNVTASIESTKASAEMIKARAEAGKGQPVPGSNLVYDIDTGKPVGKFLPGVPPEEQVKIRARAAAAQALTANLQELDKFQADVGPVYAGTGKGMLSSADSLRLQALRDKIAWNYLHAMSGAQVTVQEWERAKSIIPIDTVTWRGDAHKTLQQFVQGTVRDAQYDLSSNTTKYLTQADLVGALPPPNIGGQNVGGKDLAGANNALAPAPVPTVAKKLAGSVMTAALESNPQDDVPATPTYLKVEGQAKGSGLSPISGMERQQEVALDGLAEMASGQKVNPASAVRTQDLSFALKGNKNAPDPDMQSSAWAALQAIAEGMGSDHIDRESRDHAEKLIDWVQSQRQDSGLPPLQPLSTQDLADINFFKEDEPASKPLAPATTPDNGLTPSQR